MSENRERAVIDAFVSLAASLADGRDVVELLSGLTTDCADLLDVTSAGLLLADRRGVLHLVAASSEETRSLELFQLQREQGPCLDCFHSGAPVSVPDLSATAGRWPQFADRAVDAGFASVHAVPMRLRDTVLGALGLFGAHPGSLDAEDLRLGQALAYVAAVAIVQDTAAADTALINEQLQTALDSRVIIEQAKGVLAYSGDLEMDQAFTVLRHYARDHDQRLTDVARALTSRELPARLVLENAVRRAAERAAPGSG